MPDGNRRHPGLARVTVPVPGWGCCVLNGERSGAGEWSPDRTFRCITPGGRDYGSSGSTTPSDTTLVNAHGTLLARVVQLDGCDGVHDLEFSLMAVCAR